jgi:osmotically-inducible protein OsmY
MVSSNEFKAPQDFEIQEQILQSLHYFPEIELTDISVLVKGGYVYLSGSVTSRIMKIKLISEIEKIQGVSEVIDELVIIKKRINKGHLRSSFKDLGVQ